VFVLTLLLHPEVFYKAQEEIDETTGSTRIVRRGESRVSRSVQALIAVWVVGWY